MRSVALLLLLCARASAAAGLRVALYVGAGTAPTSAGNYSESISLLIPSGRVASLTHLAGPDVAPQLTTSRFDLVVFPGGSGSSISAGIGAAGGAAVRSFVAAGGGYLGTCAGGYLAGNSSCCAVPMAGYCGGATGCAKSQSALGLVDMGVAEPWDRGHGYVGMAYSDAAVAMLQLDAVKYGGGRNVSILYWQGPIQSRLYAGAYTVDALFRSEIAANHPQWTRGEMAGTPSLLHAAYGKGRVLVSSPHPEETVPRLDDVVAAYVLWAGGAI
jgi:glutamine amidotransferase-like uncharacterized protein